MKPGMLVAGKYRLLEELGAGATGVVFAARHEKTEQEVALKFVRPESQNPKRALREARAACAVRHENLVPISDVLEEDDGTTILVMERLHGSSLRRYLERHERLDASETTHVALGLFAGLDALHRAGIVHRDLKPDNVFVVEGDAPLSSRVRILDFGIAKLMPEIQRAETALTASGAMLGTPKYMAPEQAFGESDIDARADLWAAGAVLYECLTGSLPAPGENLGQIMKRLAQGAIVPLSEHAVAVSEPLRSVVDELLVVDRDRRLASAAEALERLRGGGVRRSPRRGPALAIGLALAAVVTGIGAFVLRGSGAGPDVTPPADANAPPEERANVPLELPTALPSSPPSATASTKPTLKPVVPLATATVSSTPSATASATAPPTTRILSEPPF